MNGTSWLLGGGYPWYSGDPSANQPGSTTSGVVANDVLGLSLPTLPDGPLGLRSPDGTLGRLTLPVGVATNDQDVFILSADGARIYRYDPILATLTPLPAIGAEGLGPHPHERAFAEPRRFRGAPNIAALNGALYVADPGAHRVQVFDLATLAVTRIHDGLIDPIDVTAGRQGIYLLDRGAGRVYRARPHRESLDVVVAFEPGRWDRIAVDSAERIYLRLDGVLHVYPSNGTTSSATAIERITNADEVRDRFAAPGIYFDHRDGLVLPQQLADPCELRLPPDPQIRRWQVGDCVYAVDLRTRILRVHFPDGRVRHRFGPYDAKGIGVVVDTPESWSPVEVIALDGCALILDERHQIVYGHRSGTETLRRWFGAPADAARRWRRIASDGTGCLLLWDGLAAVVDRLDARGRVLGQVKAHDVRDRFVHRATAATFADRPPTPRLTRHGAVPRPANEPPEWPLAAFAEHGVWTSTWLDSDLYNCQWHVLELSVDLPPGSRIVIRTRSSNEPQSDVEVQASLGSVGALGSWREVPPLAGPAQPDAASSARRELDALVPSGPGQYLQLQIALTGNGIRTPLVASLRVRFPRESLLQYLPAIYSKPDEQREFLDRLLEITHTTWSGIEQEVDTFERFLDPDSVPPHAMAYLAGWLDLRLEGTWTAEQNRRLLQAMPGLRARWGTAAGLRAWLRVYLANLGGVSVEQLEQTGMPGIVESFVDRRRVALNRADTATLGSAEALWSPSVERRFQVGVFDREGEVELVSAGDPALDVFRHYAHAFRVYVPAAWIRTPEHEALIRRAIEVQKPAHTTYELVLVEPRFRIGLQSTIDLDTVVGGPVPSPLACTAVESAPSLPPRQRLGFDTTLTGAPGNSWTGDSDRDLV